MYPFFLSKAIMQMMRLDWQETSSGCMTEIFLLKTVLKKHHVQLPAVSVQIDGGLVQNATY